MTLVDEDISAVRRAVAGLERAAQALVRHYGDTVDVQRLLTDVGRLSGDLDLLCGGRAPAAAGSPSPPAPAPTREVIPDTDYAHDFWMDAEDEGVGRYTPRAR